MASASLPSEPRNVISSLKPFCFRSRGRMSFSSVLVNSVAVLGLRLIETFRAYITNSLGCLSLWGFTNPVHRPAIYGDVLYLSSVCTTCQEMHRQLNFSLLINLGGGGIPWTCRW